MINLIRASLAELIGTAILVFVPTALAAQGKPLLVVAGAFGLVLMMLVAAFGHVSGGHFNPAVTFALWFYRKIGNKALFPYWGAQIIGATLASMLVRTLYGITPAKLGAAIPAPVLSGWQVFAIEMLGSLVFILCILGCTDGREDKKFGGLAPVGIGLALGLVIAVFGDLTGGSFNPARWLGPAFVAGEWTAWLSYLLAPLVGGLVAVFVYAFVMSDTSPPD